MPSRAQRTETFSDGFCWTYRSPFLPTSRSARWRRRRGARRQLGLPLVVRPAYTLGGTGGGIATTEEELNSIVSGGLAASPIHQVLLEKSLVGWKEIEYEVMRDAAGNCITVCNMENIDPMGVHTGDSIVVAPSQTLSDKEYQMLRSASLKNHTGPEHRGGVQHTVRPGARRRGGGSSYQCR